MYGDFTIFEQLTKNLPKMARMRYYILSIFLSNILGYSTYRLLNLEGIEQISENTIKEAGILSFLNTIDPSYQMIIYIIAMISSLLLLIHKTILHFRISNLENQ